MYRRRAFALALATIALCSSVELAHAQTCTPGTVPIGADREKARAAGIPDSAQCWSPSDATTGAAKGEAKQYLRSILCSPDGDNYGGMGADGTIQGLDAEFAVCAAKFLKAAKEQGINVCVREGKRSVDKQNEYVRRGVLACKKGAMCEHPRGIAIDVNVKPNVNDCNSYKRLHASAPSFGINFYLGCRDAYHFVPAKGSCYSGGTVPDGGSIAPDNFDFPQYYTPPAPASPFSSPLKNIQSGAFSPASSPSASSIPSSPAIQQPVIPQTGQICTPSFSCTGGIMYYNTSQCTTQVYQACTNGCNGNSCAVPTSTTTPAATSSSSSLDLLYGLTSTEVATSSPISVILNDLTADSSNFTNGATTSTSYQPSGTPLATGQLTAQETFVTPDLNPGLQSSTNGSQGILAAIKNALINVLLFLKNI